MYVNYSLVMFKFWKLNAHTQMHSQYSQYYRTYIKCVFIILLNWKKKKEQVYICTIQFFKVEWIPHSQPILVSPPIWNSSLKMKKTLTSWGHHESGVRRVFKKQNVFIKVHYTCWCYQSTILLKKKGFIIDFISLLFVLLHSFLIRTNQ